MGACLSSPSKDDSDEKPSQPAARPSGGGLQRTSVAAPASRHEDLDASENPSVKAEAGSVTAASDLPSLVSSPWEQPPPSTHASSSNGTAPSQPAERGLQTSTGTSTFSAARQSRLANEQVPGDGSSGSAASSRRKPSTPMAVPGGASARGTRSSDADAEAAGTSPKSGSGRPTAGSVPLLSRISLTGPGKTSPSGGGVGDYLRRHSSEGIRKVKEANQMLAEKAHGKDQSSTHAVAVIDPALYY